MKKEERVNRRPAKCNDEKQPVSATGVVVMMKERRRECQWKLC